MILNPLLVILPHSIYLHGEDVVHGDGWCAPVAVGPVQSCHLLALQQWPRGRELDVRLLLERTRNNFVTTARFAGQLLPFGIELVDAHVPSHAFELLRRRTRENEAASAMSEGLRTDNVLRAQVVFVFRIHLLEPLQQVRPAQTCVGFYIHEPVDLVR